MGEFSMSSSKSGFLVGTCCDHVIPRGVAAVEPGSGGKDVCLETRWLEIRKSWTDKEKIWGIFKGGKIF